VDLAASTACTPIMLANKVLVIAPVELVKFEGSRQRALEGMSEPVGTGMSCV